MVVNQTLQDNFIRPDESELAKARVKQKGQHRLIDKVDVRLVASEDKFWAHLQSFNDRYVHIPEDLVYKYDRLLQGGAWCQLDLLYNAEDDEAQKRPFYIRALKPIQVAAFDLDAYIAGRRQLQPRRLARPRHPHHRPRAERVRPPGQAARRLADSSRWRNETTTSSSSARGVLASRSSTASRTRTQSSSRAARSPSPSSSSICPPVASGCSEPGTSSPSTRWPGSRCPNRRSSTC